MRRFRRIGHRSLQGVLAAVAIAVAVALPVVLLSVGGGVSDHELASLEHAGYQIVVSAPGLHGVASSHALASSIDRLSGVRAASPILSAPVDAFGASGGPLPGLAEGVIPSAFVATEGPEERAILPTALPLGDPSDSAFFDNGRYDGPSANVVLLSAPFAASLSLGVGNTVYLAPAPDRAAALPFRISGEIGVPGPTVGPIAVYALLLPLSELQLVAGFARANGSSGALLDAADTVQVALGGAAAT
ncbi:MAG: ABC transporter permease, partial [Thermoplasmata archaeon]|nr:ABC transporter permease [Thermoplasmata archaeon]